MNPGGRGQPPDPMRTERMDLLFVGVTTAGFVLVAAAVLALVFGVPLFERRPTEAEAARVEVPGAPPPAPPGVTATPAARPEVAAPPADRPHAGAPPAEAGAEGPSE